MVAMAHVLEENVTAVVAILQFSSCCRGSRGAQGASASSLGQMFNGSNGVLFRERQAAYGASRKLRTSNRDMYKNGWPASVRVVILMIRLTYDIWSPHFDHAKDNAGVSRACDPAMRHIHMCLEYWPGV